MISSIYRVIRSVYRVISSICRVIRSIYKVIQEEKSLFCEVIVSVIVRQESS